MKKILSLALAACLLLAVTACGGGAAPASSGAAPAASGTDPAAPAASGAAPAASGDAAPAGDAAAKDTVVVSQTEEPTGFLAFDSDYVATQNKDAVTLGNIYDRLLELTPTGEIEYSLATAYEISDNGLEYTFTLRDDVFFHNGDKMTAEDVAFSYNYCLENYPVSARTMLTNLTSVEVVDETHVKMILSAPFAAFINCPTSRVGGIVNKALFEQVGFEEYLVNPVGTGPYKFVSRVSGEEVRLEAFPEYWGGEPAIKNVVIKFINNTNTQFLSLENGEIDVIINADIGSSLQMTNPELTWTQTPSASRTHILIFGQEGWILQDDNLRKAIQSAINKNDLVLGALDNYGLPMDYDVVPTYNDAPDPSLLHIVPFDAEKAKEYLAASTYNGEAIRLVVTSGSFEEQLGQIIQGQCLAVGINIEVVPVDSGTRLTMASTGEGMDMYIQSSTSSLNDVSGIGTQYRSSDTVPLKWDQTFQDEFDRLLALADTEMDHATRQGYVAEILNIINDNALSIPLVSPVVACAYNTGLSGVVPHFATWFPIKTWSW